MEGSLAPHTVVELAARYGDPLTEAEVTEGYRVADFAGFIEAYKWVTSYLRAPADYALAAARMADGLLAENVVYAEVTLSAGVMLLRKQDVAANFHAIREAVAPFASRGLRLQWIFDAVRQFGPGPAREAARRAIELRREGVIAFGLGGDELSLPTSQFRDAYDLAAANGLHRVAHAGEIGGPELVREAVELLGAERIGHGIAAVRDPYLMNWLAKRAIPLEICPASNLRTGALARQLGREPGTGISLAGTSLTDISLKDHPLPQLLRAGIPITLSTDDPAMFETHLAGEYASLADMGLTSAEILGVAETSFAAAFLPATEKQRMIATFRLGAAALALI
jgi:aminodeoxyfutalosine deaminase